MQADADSTFGSPVTSGLIHFQGPKICVPTLVVLTVQAVFLFIECGQTDRQTNIHTYNSQTQLTTLPMHRRW